VIGAAARIPLEEPVRRLLKPVLTLIAVAIAAAPAVVVVALGWYHTPLLGAPMGPGSGVLVLTVLFYVLWLPGTVFALIWAFDRVGVHYAVEQRPRHVGKKTRRRQRAGLRFLASQERAREQAERERAERQAAGERARLRSERERAGRPPSGESAADRRRREGG